MAQSLLEFCRQRLRQGFHLELEALADEHLARLEFGLGGILQQLAENNNHGIQFRGLCEGIRNVASFAMELRDDVCLSFLAERLLVSETQACASMSESFQPAP